LLPLSAATIVNSFFTLFGGLFFGGLLLLIGADRTLQSDGPILATTWTLWAYVEGDVSLFRALRIFLAISRSDLFSL